MSATAAHEPALPPLRQVAAALATTTEWLAAELAAPGAHAPEWSEFEWRIALSAAVMHGVAGLLANRLRWDGPPLWSAFLAEQRAQATRRQRRIEAQLARIDAAARATGIALVALKGAALLGRGLYAAGERPMGDIDLLVRPADAGTAAALLLAMGHLEGISTDRHRVFETACDPAAGAAIAFGEHADNPLKIELHERIAEPLPLREVDITARTTPSAWRVDPRPGLDGYRSTAALMRHLLLHAAGNMRGQGLRLIHLHDIAMLARRMDAADWDELFDASLHDGALDGWWALPPLRLVERYFAPSVPSTALARAARDCPPLLQRAARRYRLTDVSLSSPRLAAFPGIEWARSPAEALRFVAARIWPDRAARALLRRHAVAQPSLIGDGWTGRSQLHKALRWLLAAPPRTQTIYSVRRALAYRPEP